MIAVGEPESLASATHDLAGKINARVPHRNYEGATVAGNIATVGDDVIKVEVFFDTNKLMFLGADFLDEIKVSSELRLFVWIRHFRPELRIIMITSRTLA